MVAVRQRFSGLIMQELWPNVADFFQTRGSVLIVGQTILPGVPSGEAFLGGSSGRLRVLVSKEPAKKPAAATIGGPADSIAATKVL